MKKAQDFTYTGLAILLMALWAADNAYATDGYFSHGYGVRAQGAGGVGIALPQDSLVAASNPAGLSLVGDRLDIGASWFRPQREAEIENSPAPSANGKYSGDEREHFIIPEIGYSKRVSDVTTAGISVYGNGGMNTSYDRAIPLLGNTRAGVDLIQVFVKPTLSWQLSPTQYVGLGLNIAYQRFEAKGLQNFDAPGFSQAPGNVTNRGHDSSYGVGLHLGWLGQFFDERLTLGASYQSKISTTRFDKYRGLFAEDGDFDIPENYGVGVAFKINPSWTIASDIQRIRYSNVDSIGNSLSKFAVEGNALGSDQGPGFGWRDVTVYKLGTVFAVNSQLTLRAGYNHTTQPIPRGETLFNILAPAVVQDHLTLGASWKLANNDEISFSYVHAFENKVNGNNSIPAAFGGGDVNLKMHQDTLGIAYSWIL
ncbi:outer membrane protein transport protein [Methylobacillus arboreus]|uniref:OmpP1/FadL family transporter n=1 Tax=Methylobacillus arboreus TaxID=755170 RepID=UPI001E55B2F7|nr:outer membrane protein transport protein [Methylobacillus arboreus]MCB5191394.1 outer membrane protein transport protein [Methylobacillus arboreus]